MASDHTLENSYFFPDRHTPPRENDEKQGSRALPLNMHRISHQTSSRFDVCMSFPTNNIVHDKYVTIDRIGSGTFGDILRVMDKCDINKQYALKMIKYKSTWNVGQREKYETMFVSEGRTIRTLNTIKTNEIGKEFIIKCKAILNLQHKSTVGPCIVMELCGYSLLHYMDIHESAHLTISPQTIRYITVQLLSAMSFMHGVGGMIHADLKPENILIHWNDANRGCVSHPAQMPRIKIVDFGNAITFGKKIKSFNIQTLMYRAPEVLFGNRDEMSSLIDMWSVGCILFELVSVNLFPATHERLFQCRHLNSVDVRHKIYHQLSRFPPYVYNTFKSCYFEETSEPQLYHNVLHSYAQLKSNRMRHLMHKLQNLKANEYTTLIDLLSCVLDLNPVTRYSSEDAIRHPFIINKFCKEIENTHPIIKTCNDEARQKRMDRQIKEYTNLRAVEDDNRDQRSDGYIIHRHLY